MTASTEVTPSEFKDLGDGIGYLRVTQFEDSLGERLNDLYKISGLKGIVLDLRDNPGGPVEGKISELPTSAEALLGRLSKDERVATVLRKANQRDVVTVKSDANRKPLKVVVLINGGTANTAEVVAAALKEKSGATLIGAHTFGDSTFQRLITLRAGGAITVTAGKFLTADGKDFTGKGIQPDISIEAGSPKSDDSAVQRARQALAG